MAGYDAFVGDGRAAFWKQAIAVVGDDPIAAAHHVGGLIKALPVAIALAGIAVAYLLYVARPELPGRIAQAMPGLHTLLLNKWYFDEAYDRLFVRPAFAVGRILWKQGDVGIVDRLGPDGVSWLTHLAARRVARLQSGYVYHYAFAMIIGLAVFVTMYVVGMEG
jgi:NADH-quinone oxidoreductase subunit L